MGYIYMITNTANGKSYIGQTVNDPITRIKLHLAGGPGSHFIVDDVKEFGIEKFAYQILHRNVSSELLNSWNCRRLRNIRQLHLMDITKLTVGVGGVHLLKII